MSFRIQFTDTPRSEDSELQAAEALITGRCPVCDGSMSDVMGHPHTKACIFYYTAIILEEIELIGPDFIRFKNHIVTISASHPDIKEIGITKSQFDDLNSHLRDRCIDGGYLSTPDSGSIQILISIDGK